MLKYFDKSQGLLDNLSKNNLNTLVFTLQNNYPLFLLKIHKSIQPEGALHAPKQMGVLYSLRFRSPM